MNHGMTDRRTSAGIFSMYFVLFMAAFFVLGALFEFPGILREEPAYRFGLFEANRAGIVGAYYVMVFTSVLQIFMAVSLYRVLTDGGTMGLFGMVSGIAAGIFQVLGYIRWVVLVPALADTLNAGIQAPAEVFATESLINAYLGMGIGEHLGTLFLAAWLIFSSIAARKTVYLPRGVRMMMAASGWLLVPVALEALGGAFSFIGIFSVALWGVFYTFIVVFVVALLQRSKDGVSARIHWGIWLAAFAFWLANVVPAFLG